MSTPQIGALAINISEDGSVALGRHIESQLGADDAIEWHEWLQFQEAQRFLAEFQEWLRLWEQVQAVTQPPGDPSETPSR